MLAYTIKRIGLAVLVALAVSALAFLALRASGDVAIALAGEGARAEDIENIRRAYGLDRPLLVQYLDWLGHMLRGDFGQSHYFKTDVLALVLAKLPTTAILALLALGFALAISVPLGVIAAVYPNSAIDRLCLALAVLGQAMPNFFFALILIMVLAVWLHLLPVSGSETWSHFVMPTIALGYRSCGWCAPAWWRSSPPTTSAPRAPKASPAPASSASMRCATHWCRWSRLRPCSSVSCSAARW
jgi:ABC-type dipeptide/oligopeptide/nickel transport system permease component